MFRFPDSNTVHVQCDILLCERDECGESLCVTDPDSESGRSLATQQGSPGPEDDDNRMMASTTVFVVEPGVTALGEFNITTEPAHALDSIVLMIGSYRRSFLTK